MGNKRKKKNKIASLKHKMNISKKKGVKLQSRYSFKNDNDILKKGGDNYDPIKKHSEETLVSVKLATSTNETSPSKKNKKNDNKNKSQTSDNSHFVDTQKKDAKRKPEKKSNDSSQIIKIVDTAESEDLSPYEKPKSRLKRFSKKILTRFGFIFKILKIAFILCFLFILATGGAGYYLWVNYGSDLPDVTDLANKKFAQTSTIFDRDGNVLYKIYGEENRVSVTLDQVNKNVIDATISIEDNNFYKHFGFDPFAIVRAQFKNLKEEEIVQGASTITQQLAKNLYLKPEKTIDRKIKELILSLQIEWHYEKNQILELYFNKIPYGSNAFGVETAAQTFFGKSAINVSLVEASVLAALPKAPSYFSPYGSHKNELMGFCKTDNCKSPYDPNYYWGRKDIVLAKMVNDKKITQQEFENAWEEGLELQFKDLKHEIAHPHFVFYVRDFLEKKYGKEVVENGGLEIKTTLDPKLQEIAYQAIKESVDRGEFRKISANNGALVALEPSTGGVLAMVGSLNYWDNDIDGQVNVTTSLRQPGSAFKPLIYGAAIKYAGMGSGTILGDYKTRFEGDYIPGNSDNTYQGRMNIRTALAKSRNIPAIKAFYIVGEEKILEFMESVGIRSLTDFKTKFNSNPNRKWDFSYGGALAIGSGEIQLIELAGGFSAFANNGKFAPINPILEIKNSEGVVLETYSDKSMQVMDEQVAYIINSILSDVFQRPAGTWRNTLTLAGRPVAVKTGTSNKKVGKVNYPNNLLTVGYTPSLVTAVWIGNSDGKQLRHNSWGLTIAAPIWKKFMTEALEGMPIEEFKKPEGIIESGGQYFPSWWDSKVNHDSRFRPLERRNCTDEERKLDPVGCKTKEEMEKERLEKEEQNKKEEENINKVESPFISPDIEKNNDLPSSSSEAPLIAPPQILSSGGPEKPLNSLKKEDIVKEN